MCACVSIIIEELVLIVHIVFIPREQRGSFSVGCNVSLDLDAGKVDMPTLSLVLLPGETDKWPLDIVVHHWRCVSEGVGGGWV